MMQPTEPALLLMKRAEDASNPAGAASAPLCPVSSMSTHGPPQAPSFSGRVGVGSGFAPGAHGQGLYRPYQRRQLCITPRTWNSGILEWILQTCPGESPRASIADSLAVLNFILSAVCQKAVRGARVLPEMGIKWTWSENRSGLRALLPRPA